MGLIVFLKNHRCIQESDKYKSTPLSAKSLSEKCCDRLYHIIGNLHNQKGVSDIIALSLRHATIDFSDRL